MSTLRSTLVAAGAGAAVLATVAVSASAATGTAARPASSGSPAAAIVQSAAGPADGAAERWFRDLTDEQRTCLHDAGLTRPVWPLEVAERVALRDKVRAAATACDITVPDLGPRARLAQAWVDLTDEQRTCLKDTGLTRPVGRLSAEERKALRTQVVDAAKGCGITVPKAPAGVGGLGSATPGS